MINLCTKFKVHACSRYEDMNGGAKWRSWGTLGQLGVTRVHPQCHHFNRNCASILYRFRDIASYLSKVADFNPLHLHSTQIFGTRKLHRESKKQDTKLLAITSPTIIRFSIFFTSRLGSKFATNSCLNIPPRF